MVTLTPQRLQQLLTIDPSFIVNFIIGNNPNAVADKLSDVIGTRPSGPKGVGQALQFLLDTGKDNEFVEALSVPLDLGEMNADQVTAVFGAVGMRATRDELAGGLALNALRLYRSIDTGSAPEDAAPAAPKSNPATTTSMALANAAKRKKMMRVAVIAVLAIATVIGVGLLVRMSRNAA